MGQSGCGKTTLLRVIMGALRPSAGEARVLGHSTNRLDAEGLYAMRRKMGMLFQFGALFTDMSVYENVAFPLREHAALPDDLLNDLVMMKLHAVGLCGAAHLRPSDLSVGMARRVALARSIALDPQLILYDEPFTGLDPISFGVIVRLIRELNDSLGATSIIVTHDVQEALGVVDYVYFMAAGRVIAQGRPDEIRKSAEPFVRELGPVVAGLLFASRAGSAITAEIGLMKATEQLSAMEMMAVDPVARVVAPRFWGGVLSMPLLAALFSAMGIFGGYVVGVQLIGVDAGAFWSQMQAAVDVRHDILNGVIKSVVFGIAVTWIAVFEGYDAPPTAEGVSRATTRTVVTSSLAILALDFILTALMFAGGKGQ